MALPSTLKLISLTKDIMSRIVYKEVISTFAKLLAVSLFLSSCEKGLDLKTNDNYLRFHSNVNGIVQSKASEKAQPDNLPANFLLLESDDGKSSILMELSVEKNTSGYPCVYADSDNAITKATLFEDSTVGRFSVAGYDGSTLWFPLNEVTSGQAYEEYEWTTGKSYTFYGYANLPDSGMEASVDYSGVSLTCTDVSAIQSDPLLGSYSGNGNNLGTAALEFYHPMTTVIFKSIFGLYGGKESEYKYKIHNMSLTGVHKTGSTKLSSSGSGSWVTEGITAVSQAVEATLEDGSPIGEPFLLIPQDLSTDAVLLTMTSTSNGGNYAYHRTTLNTGSWQAGYKYIYSMAFTPCFLPGTLITLADGSRKPIEDITYDDELKVWNFDKGCFDSSKVLWLTKKGLTNDHYVRCTFSDGTVLNVTGKRESHHKLYNYTERFFQPVSKMELGTKVFTENGVVSLVSRECIEGDVEYYNLMTDKHVNCFVNGVLASSRYNSPYPIGEDMIFVKDDRKIRPYKEFEAVGISREWYDGLRLGEQTASLEKIKKDIDKYEVCMREKPQTDKPCFLVRIWNWIKNFFKR